MCDKYKKLKAEIKHLSRFIFLKKNNVDMRAQPMWNKFADLEVMVDNKDMLKVLKKQLKYMKKTAKLMRQNDIFDRSKKSQDNPYERYEKRTVLSGEDWV